MGWSSEDIWNEFNRANGGILINQQRFSLLQAATRMEIAEAIREQTPAEIRLRALKGNQAVIIERLSRVEHGPKFEEALLGALNDIFCAIDSQKGTSMEPKNVLDSTGQVQGQEPAEEKPAEEKQEDVTLSNRLDAQAVLILGLQNHIDAIWKNNQEQIQALQKQNDAQQSQINELSIQIEEIKA